MHTVFKRARRWKGHLNQVHIKEAAMKILIVEDDRSYRAMLYEFLHSEGHEVLAVSDALHAVALLTEDTHGIELVLLDLKMPRLGGCTLLETFANWPRGTQTRFVVMSGEPEYALYTEHPLAVACLHKPFSFAQLKQVIEKAHLQLEPLAS
jgi:two-component system cell cycle sensor histidine kinase/response regulator CckA